MEKLLEILHSIAPDILIVLSALGVAGMYFGVFGKNKITRMCGLIVTLFGAVFFATLLTR